MKVIGRIVLIAGAVFAFSAAANAQDVVKERQDLMKTVGANTKAGADLLKAGYDAAKAEAAMRAIAGVPPKFLALLTEGTDSSKNANTTAKPEVWSEMADFKARMDEFVKLANAAGDAAKGGADAFKPAFGELTKQCAACHEKYRIKR